MRSDENWSEHREAGKLFRLLSDAGAMALPQAMEHVRFDTAFLMKDDQGAACGRLHVSIASGFLTEDSTPMFAMTLTARGAPLGPGLDGALKFLDLGHRWIVRSFTELTTDPMHKTWGMKTR